MKYALCESSCDSTYLKYVSSHQFSHKALVVFEIYVLYNQKRKLNNNKQTNKSVWKMFFRSTAIGLDLFHPRNISFIPKCWHLLFQNADISARRLCPLIRRSAQNIFCGIGCVCKHILRKTTTICHINHTLCKRGRVFNSYKCSIMSSISFSLGWHTLMAVHRHSILSLPHCTPYTQNYQHVGTFSQQRCHFDRLAPHQERSAGFGNAIRVSESRGRWSQPCFTHHNSHYRGFGQF